jgi:hypothetical protein
VQASETEVPTLQTLVPSPANFKAHVEALPSKVEQAVLPATQPVPFVLHPVKKRLHSALVVAVVL